jgi:hypothetical protein
MRAIIIQTDYNICCNVILVQSDAKKAPCCCPRAVRCERVPRAHAHRAPGWRSSMHTPVVALAQSAARECPVLTRTVHPGGDQVCTRRLLPSSPLLPEQSDINVKHQLFAHMRSFVSNMKDKEQSLGQVSFVQPLFALTFVLL